MAKTPYLTAPPAGATRMPSGIPYIVGNEAAERFSYYGMRGILTAFMTKHLMNADGQLATMSGEDAKYYFHLFASAVYFFPIIGAILSDLFLGKYRTILAVSIIYCLGHLALALDETRLGLAIGLTLIAIGSGGIKPCVSAHVGDQFGASNQKLLPKVFGWFYFSINFGAFLSTLLTPWLLEHVGPHVAFGVPGLLMLIATVVFWMGRRTFVHVPAGGVGFLKEVFSGEGLRAILKLAGVFAFVAVFWSLYDQSGSAWILQAENMDRQWFGMEILPSQVQSVNPLMIMVLIPVCSYGLYPAISIIFPLNALRKISIGFFITALAFCITAMIESWIDAGQRPHIVWQIVAYLVLTLAEVMVSITCLEFAYTQAPNKMKSFIMAVFMLSISLGNLFTAAVNQFIQNPDGTTKLEGASYYWFFVIVMFATSLVFVIVAKFYREQTHIQSDQTNTEHAFEVVIPTRSEHS
jgi:POT family proton-dependent oligopeptide transporter